MQNIARWADLLWAEYSYTATAHVSQMAGLYYQPALLTDWFSMSTVLLTGHAAMQNLPFLL